MLQKYSFRNVFQIVISNEEDGDRGTPLQAEIICYTGATDRMEVSLEKQATVLQAEITLTTALKT